MNTASIDRTWQTGSGPGIDGSQPAFRVAPEIETRNDVPLSELHEDSRLPPGASSAFRGNISIPEGQAGRAVYLDLRDGYIAQELPFIIEVEAFRISYWGNGQPRSYESDLGIHDAERSEPLRQTIAVNHPLQYRGHASYIDGGTEMDLVFWPQVPGFLRLPDFPSWWPYTFPLAAYTAASFQFAAAENIQAGFLLGLLAAAATVIILLVAARTVVALVRGELAD